MVARGIPAILPVALETSAAGDVGALVPGISEVEGRRDASFGRGVQRGYGERLGGVSGADGVGGVIAAIISHVVPDALLPRAV